jgi:ACS family tartrate transporter-like MFS transporter
MVGVVNAAVSKVDYSVDTYRKISLRLIPLLAVCYGVAYVDRVNVGFAALQMNRDLHFSASTYGLGAGLFFLSYAACEIPANLLLMRFGARRWIGRIMVTWGLLAAAMILVRKPWQFYSIRLLLGAAEAGFFPGVIYYLTLWFPERRRARAISNFYVAIPLSVIFMASASGYLLDMNGRWGLTGWQWMFIIEAVPAVLLGGLVFAVLPNGPDDACWLSKEERAVVTGQLAIESDQTSSARRTTVREAFKDKRMWQIAAFMFANFIAAYGWSFTGPLLIKEITGFSNKTVGFIAAGISLIGAVAILSNGRIAKSKSSSYTCIIFSGVLVSLGCLGVGLFHMPVLIILSLALIPTFHNATFPPVYALAASFLAKRGAAAGVALLSCVGIVGGFIGPYYLGLAKDFLGSYQKGFLTIGILCFVGLALMIRLRNKMAATNV